MFTKQTTAVLLAAVAPLAVSETIVLNNGDVINAPITAQSDDGVLVLHPSLGEIPVKRSEIKSIYANPEAMQAASVEAAARNKADALKEKYAADAGLFGTGFLKGWNRRLNVGITGAEGNSQNTNLRIAFKGDYETPQNRWIVDLTYRAGTSDGETTENQFAAGLTRDWLLPEKDYFYFASGGYEWDQFQDWDSRLSGFGGVGYQFLKDETWDVRGRAGIGGNQTVGSTINPDEFTPEALAGIEADYKIDDGHTIAFSSYMFPSLQEVGDFRNVTTLDYIVGLRDDMDLTLGMANEYDSVAPAGVKKNDFTYYITLGWTF